MNTQGKSLLAVSVATALGGATGAADAAVYTATLTEVLTYSNQGTAGSAGNITSSTATWSYDSVTGLLSQTGGTYNVRFTTAPTSTLFRTLITGLVLGNSAPASADTFVCTEGNFGGGVGASICGNYSLGANFVNNSTSTWGPGTAVARTLGGDDVALGAQQSIATLDSFATASFDPGTTLVLTNKTCTGVCATLPSGAYNGGQQWTLGSLVEVIEGAVADTATAEAGELTELDVLANDVGYTDPVTVTIDVAPDNGGTAQVTAGTDPADVRINYTSAPGFTGVETFTYRAVSGALDTTGEVTVTVEDTVPDAFSFDPQTGVPLATVVTSAVATIGGISTGVPISVANGEYSIDGDPFTTAPGTVLNNQEVAVRHTSAALPATPTVTTLTVNGVDAEFTSTTELEDTTPNAFSFAAETDVPQGSERTSAAATITGINSPAAISITNGTYSIDGGAYVSTPGTISNGQAVTVRLTSAGAPSTAATATLTVGGVDAEFTVTTAAAADDLTPNAFAFTDQSAVALSTVIVSAPVTITGIDGAAPIAVTGGEYSIDDGAFTSAAGTVTSGQTVRVRHTSAATYVTAVTTTLSVGPAGAGTQVSDEFRSTTLGSGSGGSSSADGLLLSLLGLLGLRRRRNSRS